VRIGCTRLGVQVVTVVPDNYEPKVRNRREGCRARADGDSPGASGDRQEASIALSRSAIGTEGHVMAGAEQHRKRRIQPSNVSMVG